MKSRLAQPCRLKNSRGAVLPMVGVLLIVFLGIAALAIDIGYRNTTKNELQNVADAAALAGAGYLGSVYASDDYNDLSPSQRQNYIFNRSEIVAKVRDAAGKNKAAGVSISIRDEDIVIGKWDQGSKSVNPATLVVPDAVQVVSRRDDQANSPISTFFAQVFNFNTLAVEAVAAAALTGQSNLEPGEVKLPFALSQLQFPDACRDPVQFNSYNYGCAAWHTFTSDSVNADDMADMLYGIIRAEDGGIGWLKANIKFPGGQVPPVFTSPQVIGGNTSFAFSEGVMAKLFTGTPSPMQALFDFWKTRDDDGNDSVWTTTVPVYKETNPSCTPANQKRIIVGAANIIVSRVNPPPNNSIDAIIDCSYKSIRGSGGIGGNVGTIPNLVR